MSNETLAIDGTSALFHAVAPAAIQQLKPRFIIIRPDDMVINCAWLTRLGLFAYSTNSHIQGGAQKLADGLWLYDSSDYRWETNSIANNPLEPALPDSAAHR